MLNFQQKEILISKRAILSDALDGFRPSCTLEFLEHFENTAALEELKRCFCEKKIAQLKASLLSFFTQRWERIRNTNLCYTKQPENRVNQFCLEIATAIAAEPFTILMPTLKYFTDVYDNSVHELNLNAFILSDDGELFIPVLPCLSRVTASNDGCFRHVVARGKDYSTLLTANEMQRLSSHSTQAKAMFEALRAFNNYRFAGDDIGIKLRLLALALEGGSVEVNGETVEMDAGEAANHGIIAFSQYWEGLSAAVQANILAKHEGLYAILDRLFRPAHENYKEDRYCVRLLAEALEPTIRKYDENITHIALRDMVLAKEQALRAALSSAGGLINIPSTRISHHILTAVYKLSQEMQAKMFHPAACKDALHYVLAQQPEALLTLELEEYAKKFATFARVNTVGDSALIVAAKQGQLAVLRTLVNWGAKLEHQNINRRTALHWAANNGHVEVVRFLLAQSFALLKIQDNRGDTALHLAVAEKQSATVNFLLAQKASLTLKNNAGDNVFDLALRTSRYEIIEPVLKAIASLPQSSQSMCLHRLNEAHQNVFPNVFFYTIIHDVRLFNVLLETALVQLNKNERAIFTMQRADGMTLLMIAAQAGRLASVEKLLALGVDIKSADVDGMTALHWAAYEGYVHVVDYLLSHGAELEAKTVEGNSPLYIATIRKQIVVVDFLLTQKASLTLKNDAGESSFDIALRTGCPEISNALLRQMANLSQSSQSNCLNNLNIAYQNAFSNVLFYVALNVPTLFDELLEKILAQPDKDRRTILLAQDRLKKTVLMMAVIAGAMGSVKKLLALEMEVNVQDAEGYTALHWAVFKGYVEIANYLLAQGALLELQTDQGHTPLIIAVLKKKQEAVKFLLIKNAEITRGDKAGKNAFDLAHKINAPDIIDILLQHIASLSQTEQRSCFKNMGDYVFPNVLFYAAKYRPILFDELLNTILKQPEKEKRAILAAQDMERNTVLRMSIIARARISTEKLLNMTTRTLYPSRFLAARQRVDCNKQVETIERALGTAIALGSPSLLLSLRILNQLPPDKQVQILDKLLSSSHRNLVHVLNACANNNVGPTYLQLEKIWLYYQEMRTRAVFNLIYQPAADTAITVFVQCVLARANLPMGSDTIASCQFVP